MIEQATEATVADLASFLKAKKSQGQRLGLFVGSRAGALLDDDNLYKILMHHISATNNVSMLRKQPTPLLEPHLQALKDLSASVKFKECYDILSKHFSKNEIHFILVQALKSNHNREMDDLIAGFFKGGFLDTIITTNIDTVLEDSCKALWNMQQTIDYHVFSYGMNKSEEIKQGESRYGRIIKIFGDLSSLHYKTAGNEFNLENDPIIKQYLRTKLSEEVVVIGYDSTWDRPLEHAFPEFGGALWYVNDELPAQNTHLMHVLNQRKGRYLTVIQGNIHGFLKTLYDEIGEGISRNTELIDASAAPQSQTQVRKKAFISYSHNDKKQMERLQTHLKGYLHISNEDFLDYWDDTKIRCHNECCVKAPDKQMSRDTKKRAAHERL